MSLPIAQSIGLLAIPLVAGGLGKLLVMGLLSLKRESPGELDPPTVLVSDGSVAYRGSGRASGPGEARARRVRVDVTIVTDRRPVVVHADVAYPVSESDLRNVLAELGKQTPA